MTMWIKAAVCALASLMLGCASVPANDEAASAKSSDRHAYVMRHLQKGAGDDPPLSQEGTLLANVLAGQLGSHGIKAVFATSTRRAIQTGEPLARFLKVPVTPYDPRNVAALVAAVSAVGGNVLVVGHSNTVPELVAAFGGARPAPMTDDDDGTIYQVSTDSGAVREFHVTASPVPARFN